MSITGHELISAQTVGGSIWWGHRGRRQRNVDGCYETRWVQHCHPQAVKSPQLFTFISFSPATPPHLHRDGQIELAVKHVRQQTILHLSRLRHTVHVWRRTSRGVKSSRRWRECERQGYFQNHRLPSLPASHTPRPQGFPLSRIFYTRIRLNNEFYFVSTVKVSLSKLALHSP